ncbi:MAG: sugar phosphate nucleotidyltransferase [Deltaproteobacteria bacterium]|nr:sugar phosphate nucleotidyltransferase [Deltaproteobacteria bacterium]MCX7952507.1 sugar phosphate nucleotidyltransferase [Deltaproteobacteria bacterium]
MKGIVLAGGLGTRLYPCTRVTNKHLLPVYNKPMIYYPIEALVKLGITEIMVVTGGNYAGDFLKLLGSGKEFGLKHIHYTYQEKEGGIAEALGLCEHFCSGDSMVVFLGDNIIQGNVKKGYSRFLEKGARGAMIFLKEVEDCQRFGVPEFDNAGKLLRIVEKPQNPPSKYAVTGIYMYDSSVFDYIKKCVPSGRGELEITDVNNFYIQAGLMDYEILDGWWTDAGTFDSLLRASQLVQLTGANNDH